MNAPNDHNLTTENDYLVHDDVPVPAECIHIPGCTCVPFGSTSFPMPRQCGGLSTPQVVTPPPGTAAVGGTYRVTPSGNAGPCDCETCAAGDDQWCCRKCHELAKGESRA